MGEIILGESPQKFSGIEKMKVLLVFALLAVAASSATTWNVQLQDGTEALKLCELCTETIGVVQKFVKAFDAQEKKSAKEWCQKVPIVGGICEQYFDKALDYVEKADDKKVCTKIKACK